jgi:exosortase family protein XrtF
MVLGKYYQKLYQIPAPVKSFLIKGLLIFVAWKFIYLLFLLPSRIIDKPLTEITAKGTVATLNFFSASPQYYFKNETDVYEADGLREVQPLSSVFFQNNKILSIADVCNALELMVLYAGFIVSFPAAAKRKTIFIVSGILLIFLINILRCAGLAWIFLYHPQYGDFSHHYAFTFIVYLTIFLLWFWFTKKPALYAKT